MPLRTAAQVFARRALSGGVRADIQACFALKIAFASAYVRAYRKNAKKPSFFAEKMFAGQYVRGNVANLPQGTGFFCAFDAVGRSNTARQRAGASPPQLLRSRNANFPAAAQQIILPRDRQTGKTIVLIDIF